MNMQGWKIYDEGNTTFTFPQLTLGVGTEVKIWTGSGSNSATNLYWKRERSVWNNDGDTATLKDKNGQVIDQCNYNGGGSIANCP